MLFTYFTIGGQKAIQIDATLDVTTDAYPFANSHKWMVSINNTGVVDGSATWTIEVSNNKVKWYNLSLEKSTDVPIKDAVDGICLGYNYMRISYKANGTSSGTVDFELSLQNNTKSSNL